MPVEFIKVCKTTLTHSIVTVLNFIIETRDFPIKCASGLRSAIFKTGKQSQVDNFRGNTILPIIEKILKIVVCRRFAFVNEAFNETDRYNGGFLCGSRTSDNISVMDGLIGRQLTLGKSFLVCFVGFSTAFDGINRNMLFYKLSKNGWTGRVIDIRNLKTSNVLLESDQRTGFDATKHYLALHIKTMLFATRLCFQKLTISIIHRLIAILFTNVHLGWLLLAYVHDIFYGPANSNV